MKQFTYKKWFLTDYTIVYIDCGKGNKYEKNYLFSTKFFIGSTLETNLYIKFEMVIFNRYIKLGLKRYMYNYKNLMENPRWSLL